NVSKVTAPGDNLSDIPYDAYNCNSTEPSPSNEVGFNIIINRIPSSTSDCSKLLLNTLIIKNPGSLTGYHEVPKRPND
ncbi:10792_t:CDS:2, partial [Scutellospora calospora]